MLKFPEKLTKYSLDLFNENSHNPRNGYVIAAWRDTENIIRSIELADSDVLNSREMQIALRSYFYCEEINKQIDDFLIEKHIDTVKVAMRLAFWDYLENPEHDHWKYLLENRRLSEFSSLCKLLSEHYWKLKNDVDEKFEVCKSIPFEKSIVAVSILHWQEIVAKHQEESREFIISNECFVKSISGYLNKAIKEQKKFDIFLNQTKLCEFVSIFTMDCINGKKDDILNKIYGYIVSDLKFQEYKDTTIATFIYDAKSEWNLEKQIYKTDIIDDLTVNAKNTLLEVFYKNYCSDDIQKLAENNILGSIKNHDSNKITHMNLWANFLILKNYYGIKEKFSFQGNEYDLGNLLMVYAFMKAHYYEDFFQKYNYVISDDGFENSYIKKQIKTDNKFYKNANLFIMKEGIIGGGKDRSPVRINNFQNLAKNYSHGGNIIDPNQIKILATDIKSVDDNNKPDINLLLQPMLRYDDVIIDFPFIHAFNNEQVSLLNIIKRYDYTDARRLETMQIEEIVKQEFTNSPIFKNAKISANQSYGNNKGEIDLIVYKDRTLILIEIKSTSEIREYYERYLHERKLMHAGHQLSNAVEHIKNDNRFLREITGEKDICWKDIVCKPFIVSTCFEFDHCEFSGNLKISLLELFTVLHPTTIIHLIDDLSSFGIDVAKKAGFPASQGIENLLYDENFNKEIVNYLNIYTNDNFLISEFIENIEDKIIWNKVLQYMKHYSLPENAELIWTPFFPNGQTNIVVEENSAEYFFLKGQDLFERGEYKQAIIQYKKALQISNESIYIYLYKLGEAYYYTKEYQKANNTFDKIIKKHPQNKLMDNIYNFKGLSSYNQNYLDEAIEFFSKGIEFNPDNDILLAMLARTYDKKKDFDKAEKYYLESLAKNPNNSDTLYNFAWFCYEQKKLDLAMNCYKKYVEINPDDWKIYKNMGVCELERKNIGEAKEYYAKALSIVQRIGYYSEIENLEKIIYICDRLLLNDK